MSSAPVSQIDLTAFTADPYPALARMRAQAPVTYVPQLRATLLTRRDDIFAQEKRIDLFSSDQPAGLVVRIMGPNMMRKDGDAHLEERRALFPALGPRTVRDHLSPAFARIVDDRLARLRPLGAADIVRDYAMPVAADALRLMTGLTNIPTSEMDRASQEMIDGCANYAGDPEIAARAHAASARVDAAIDARLPALRAEPDLSVISVLDRAGLSRDRIAGNVKVIIGGGQNEPRDAIAGMVWALLTNPDQQELITGGQAGWGQAFDEYVRLVTPIGMVPRRVARAGEACGVSFEEGEMILLFYSSACRDEAHFADPDRFDITRDTGPAIPFGAGPHFCAGAAAARCLIADHAVPRLFDALPGLRLDGPVPFSGWAFRGPTRLPVTWKA
ncbi:MAG: cytochrome P450 [Rhodobacteraceae bacterium]|nr:MAG: cytochrome P450 [Paracoccaceae bacterium]